MSAILQNPLVESLLLPPCDATESGDVLRASTPEVQGTIMVTVL